MASAKAGTKAATWPRGLSALTVKAASRTATGKIDGRDNPAMTRSYSGKQRGAGDARRFGLSGIRREVVPQRIAESEVDPDTTRNRDGSYIHSLYLITYAASV